MSHPIAISVKTEYIEPQSVPDKNRYVFSYTITITNRSDIRCQLISRHWLVRDELNQVQEVKGLGVIGQQPALAPGESYTYSSGVIIPTRTGSMTGSYQMMDEQGQNFDAPIPEFALVPPHLLN